MGVMTVLRALAVGAVAVASTAGCGSSGGSWVRQDVPTDGMFTRLTVWASGTDDVWLGGTSIWHYDGTAWTETPPPVSTGVVAFWGFASDDVWAIGDANVLHWNGTAWSDVPTTTNVGFTALWAIWGASTNDLWIANQDNSHLFHWDGTGWTEQTLQFVSANALWGSASDDIWLTGTFDTWHYDGQSWARYDANDTPGGGYDLWGFGADDVWMAGGYGAMSRWDGQGWTEVTALDGSYNGVWGSAPDDVYAVGDFGVVSHYDGSGWSSSTELTVQQNFSMVHGSSPDNVWATAVDLQAQRGFVMRLEP